MRIKNGATDLVFFLFTDHLGSTNVTSDPNGLMVSLNLYMPWGGSRGGAGTALTDYGFNGQRSMEATIGLYYFNARWFDSSLGRWTQPDSIVPQASQGVQAWNRYEFVNNNPIGNTDTNGHMIDCHEVGCVTPGTTITNAGHTYYNDQANDNGDTSQDTNRGGGRPRPPTTNNTPPITVGGKGLCINWQNIGCSGTYESNSAATFMNAGWWLKVSTTLQDLSFGVSATGAILEIVGAATGPQDYLAARGLYGDFLNPLEGTLSVLSTIAAGVSDSGTGQSTLTFQNNSLNIKVGESSTTSLGTTIAGLFVNSGTGDAIIDGYASGYSHGIFPSFAPGGMNITIPWGGQK